jgi:hypothetical protein
MFPAMVPVHSTNLAAVGYDPTAATLFVQFNNGTVYRYLRVPVAVYEGLMTASSHGKFFNRYVRYGPYPYLRIR